MTNRVRVTQAVQNYAVEKIYFVGDTHCKYVYTAAFVNSERNTAYIAIKNKKEIEIIPIRQI